MKHLYDTDKCSHKSIKGLQIRTDGKMFKQSVPGVTAAVMGGERQRGDHYLFRPSGDDDDHLDYHRHKHCHHHFGNILHSITLSFI